MTQTPSQSLPSLPQPPAAAPSPAKSPESKDHFIRHANLMSSLTIISRIAGLLRDKLWSAYLGLGVEFSSFWMGFQFPNLSRRIFGEGALTAIFVPVYARIQTERGQEAANRLAAVTTSFLILVLGGITILGELFLIPAALSSAISPNNRLTALMLAIMLPYCVMVCLVALFGAIATVHDRFAAQAISPVILNLTAATAAVLPVLLFTANYPFNKRVVWVACAVVLAGIFQILLMLPTLRKSGVKLSLLLETKNSGIRDVIKPLLPMIVGLSAVQFNTFMDGQIAYWLSPDGHANNPAINLFGRLITLPLGSGALAKLSAAQRLYMLPVGIFGVSMATAIFPMLSKAAAANNLPEVKRLLVTGLRKTLFLSFPASFGMILIAHALISVIYSGPKVSPSDIDRAAWAAIWFCAGIWCFEAQLVILRVFYAMRDTATPMKTAVAMVFLNFSLNITLVWFMQEGGLALSTSISALLQSVILLFILRRRLGPLGLSSLRNSVLKALTASLIMAVATLAVRYAIVTHHIPSKQRTTETLWTAFILLPALIATAAPTYALIAYLLKMPELQDLPLLGRHLKPRQ